MEDNKLASNANAFINNRQQKIFFRHWIPPSDSYTKYSFPCNPEKNLTSPCAQFVNIISIEPLYFFFMALENTVAGTST